MHNAHENFVDIMKKNKELIAMKTSKGCWISSAELIFRLGWRRSWYLLFYLL